MSKKPFKADQWLIDSSQTKTTNKGHKERNSLSGGALSLKDNDEQFQKALYRGIDQDFSPSNFLIPGWTGEGLISREAIKLKNLLQTLVQDAQNSFSKVQWNKKQRKNIFKEFLSYTNYAQVDHQSTWIEQNPKFKDENFFWNSLYDSDVKERETLEGFIHSFCFRSVTVYLFKVRFITYLSQQTDQSTLPSTLLNPTAFLNRCFRKGSSTELQAKSLQVNEYSWFLPSAQHTSDILKVAQKMTEISTTELMKVFMGETPSPNDDTKINFKDSEYSHSLSHKAFGLFVHDLLTKMPKWVDTDSVNQGQDSTVNVLNTLFAGENMTALTLSHWLAQENLIPQTHSEIVCPEFVSPKYKNGSFLKYCHELQYLFFLIKVAQKHSKKPIPFISKVMKEKQRQASIHNDSSSQMSIFQAPFAMEADQDKLSERSNEQEKVYHRVVLNLLNFPKKNPHHYLTQSIYKHGNTLKENGVLFIFSNQKLFVPSQAQRVKQLTEKYHILANFTFEQLKGRGEIANHLYILKKKPLLPKYNQTMNWDARKVQELKESCLTFRFSGNLSIFHKFLYLKEGLLKFIQDKDPQKTPIFQQEIAENITFEFYQDAILDGKLLSSSSKDSSHITHPLFFKKLVNSSFQLSHLFHIESLNSTGENKSFNNLPAGFLGITLNNDKKFPFVLIVNHTEPTDIKLELIKYESYHAKKETYGHAFYHYFGLTPKVHQININLFREYFETSLGHQVIQLCLNGGPSKLKSKLKSLLIPKFFADMSSFLDENTDEYRDLELLYFNKEKLLSSHPENLLKQWPRTCQQINRLKDGHTWYVLGQLAHFKAQLKYACDLIGDHNLPIESQFTNQLIIEELLKLKTSPIFPNHNELYIEFLKSQREELQVPLTDIKLDQEMNDEKSDQTFVVSLIHQDQTVLKLHGPESIIKFTYFILSSSNGVDILTFLNSLEVPSDEELSEVLNHIQALQSTLSKLLNEVDEHISQIFIHKITS